MAGIADFWWKIAIRWQNLAIFGQILAIFDQILAIFDQILDIFGQILAKNLAYLSPDGKKFIKNWQNLTENHQILPPDGNFSPKINYY